MPEVRRRDGGIRMEDRKVVETLFIRRAIEVTTEDIDDILCGSLEGGSTFWCDSVEVVGSYLGEYASEQISRGGKLRFHVYEPFDDENTEWYELDQEKFLHGLQEWLNNYAYVDNCLSDGQLDCGMIDAGMADSIIQYALFDEEIFG